MIRKESTTWHEDTTHAAKVGAVVLALIILGLVILQPLDHQKVAPAEQAEVTR